MCKTSFRPCTTCPIPFITTCNAGGCTNNKGKGFVNRTNLSAIKMEKLKTDFEKNGCPYCL